MQIGGRLSRKGGIGCMIPDRAIENA
jgi:hypothetical protein